MRNPPHLYLDVWKYMEEHHDLGLFENGVDENSIVFGCWNWAGRTVVLATDKPKYYVTLYNDGSGSHHQATERVIGIEYPDFDNAMVSVVRWLQQGLR